MVNLVVDDYRDQPVVFPDEAHEQIAKIVPEETIRARVRVRESCSRGDVKLEVVESTSPT